MPSVTPTVHFGGNGAAGWRVLAICLDYWWFRPQPAADWSVTTTGEPTGPEGESVFREVA